MAIEFEFRNYKVFKDLQKFKLRNVTIILGKNNSGKSAILKLPKLISDVAKYSEKPLLLSSNNFIFAGSYQDFIYGKANRAFDLTIRRDNLSNSELSMSIIVENQDGEYNPIFEKWSFKNISFELEGPSNVFRYKESLIECEFTGFNLDYFKIDNESYASEIKEVFGNPPNDFYNFKTTYIGPIRDKIDRFIDLSEIRIANSYSDYFNYLEILIDDFKTIDKKIFSKVSKWYEVNFDGWELGVDLDKEPIYSLFLRKDGVKINILDTGIGINQVLPILIKTAVNNSDFEIISIEEPEAHLNPAVHGNLLEEIVKDALENSNKYYLLETHSENFVLRLRRLIAEGIINPDFCGIYNVDFDPQSISSKLTEIKVLENGEVNFWPSDIFNDTFNEVIAIRSAQK